MKFIRDIINDKRSVAQPEEQAAPSEDTLLEPQDAQSGALDLGAYLTAPEQPERAKPAPAQDAGEYDEDYYDDEADLEGYYDEDYADDEEEVKAEAEQPAGAQLREEPVPAADPMDQLFAQRVEPGHAPSPEPAEDYTDNAAEFFADSNTSMDDAEEEPGMMDDAAPVQGIPSQAPASIADLRRSIAAERVAPRHEVSEEMRVAEAAPGGPLQMPAPAPGRGSSRSGRVKTRLLGFTPGTAETTDPIARAEQSGQSEFAVGWVVVVEGPGRGASFTLFDGVSKIGRGGNQAVSLNFGDNSISRDNHVSIAYDGEMNQFFIGHSGKANLVRVNNKPLLSTEEIRTGDHIRVGETTLRLIALCGDDFSWNAPAEKDTKYA